MNEWRFRYLYRLSFASPPTTPGLVQCDLCFGTGLIVNGGTRKNQIQRSRLPGLRVTSVNILNGHRHYVVSEILSKTEVVVRNSCGEQKDVRVSVDELKRKEKWRLGWVTLEEIREAERGPLKGKTKECHKCKAKKMLECRTCYGMGEV